jgi:phosphate-selective porin
MALNAMVNSPALDAQTGAMVFGKLFDDNFGYYLAITNGNNWAKGQIDENNGAKDYTAKFTYRILPELVVGLGFDADSENSQTIAVNDLAGGAFATFKTFGRRNGFSPDAFWESGAFSARAEYLYFKWDEDPNAPTLQGGFAQAAYFITGTELQGFQALARFETVKLEGAGTSGDSLNAYLAGWQWFINSGVRHQLNLVMTQPNGAGSASGVYADGGTRFAILSELQIRL